MTLSTELGRSQDWFIWRFSEYYFLRFDSNGAPDQDSYWVKEHRGTKGAYFRWQTMAKILVQVGQGGNA